MEKSALKEGVVGVLLLHMAAFWWVMSRFLCVLRMARSMLKMGGVFAISFLLWRSIVMEIINVMGRPLISDRVLGDVENGALRYLFESRVWGSDRSQLESVVKRTMSRSLGLKL